MVEHGSESAAQRKKVLNVATHWHTVNSPKGFSRRDNPLSPPILLCYIQWPEEPAMNLSETIQKDLVQAMRDKDELHLSVLRGIKAAIKHKEVEKIRTLDEPESIQVLQTLVKQRKESIEHFTKGNRPELAEKETKELAIIESYLPAGASEAEMDAAITKAISETGANSIKQMGAVVKAAKSALQGKTVDGKVLSDRVRERLSKPG